MKSESRGLATGSSRGGGEGEGKGWEAECLSLKRKWQIFFHRESKSLLREMFI